MDFTVPDTMNEAVKFLSDLFPKCEIFAVGFSLGGNHILRAAGAENPCFTAIATVSQPFDVLATTLQLKRTLGGVYDMFIWDCLRKPFQNQRFTGNYDLIRRWDKRGVFDFDNQVRAKMLGYKSAHDLYRQTSW